MNAITPHDFDDEGNEASARAAGRDSLFLIGTLQFVDDGSQYPIRIRNLSATGLMAEGKIVGRVNARVFIETKQLGRIPGTVAWTAEGRMGIAFDSEIDPRVARQPVGKQVLDLPDYLKQKSFRRPGF